jgi:5'-3' exonuclease
MATDPSPITDTSMLNRERPRLVIVDAHGHAFRAFHALAPMQAPDGLPTNALFGLAGMLRRIVVEERPDRVAVVFDDADGQRRTFRSTLYPAYKAHRPERPEALARQIPLMRELTRAFGLEALEHPDFEADDLIATLVVKAEAEGFETTILAADKDLMQLVSNKTTLWDSMRGKRYTPAAVQEKLGVPPRIVADYLALIGDTSDNVPGVSGIGPKGASKLLEAHGSLAGIYEHLALVSPRERARLEAARDLAFFAKTDSAETSNLAAAYIAGDDALRRSTSLAAKGDVGDIWCAGGFAASLLAVKGRGCSGSRCMSRIRSSVLLDLGARSRRVYGRAVARRRQSATVYLPGLPKVILLRFASSSSPNFGPCTWTRTMGSVGP